MDLNSSPGHSPPDYASNSPSSVDNQPTITINASSTQTTDNSPDMAALVANGSVPNMPGPVGVNLDNANKRYRPAPAKTFQCRGYGECRMVFSRSEHLARHIRKHTGERPFSCHCSKQFSRLDNLRQHAQTVHADKQDQNERMMRDLTSLHATMAAANKVGGGRAARRHPPAPIKQEELGSIPMHQRPGTSTGYEGDLMYQPNSSTSWTDADRTTSSSLRQASSHSFREPGQSFLVPPTTSTAAGSSAQSQSFLDYPGSHHFLSSERPGSRPTSRPTTATGAPDSNHPRSLPPLSAVVSASIASSQQFPFQHPSSLTLRRPSTATRPGTAPASASLFSSKSVGFDRSGMGSSSGIGRELPLLHSGFGRSASSGFGNEHHQQFQLGPGHYDGELASSPAGNDSSPFYFHPPSDNPPSATSPSTLNPRKRAWAGPDGPYDDAPAPSHPSLRAGGDHQQQPPGSSSGRAGDGYDYGSDSRPQSRRLSVMELCNDQDAQPPPSRGGLSERDRDQYASGSGSFLLSAAATTTAGYGYDSRPTTSSGLVSSASNLHIFDRSCSPQPNSATQPQSLFTRTASAPAATARVGGTTATTPAGARDGAATSADGDGSTADDLRGRGISSSQRHIPASDRRGGSPIPVDSPDPSNSPTPPATAPPAAPGGVLQPYAYPYPYRAPHLHQQFTHPPTFSSSPSSTTYSPRYRSPASASDGSSSPASSPFPPAHSIAAARSPAGAGSGPGGVYDASSPSPSSPSSTAPTPTSAPAVSGSAMAGANRTRGHGHGHQRQPSASDGQVRISVSPHASAGFGMRV